MQAQAEKIKKDIIHEMSTNSIMNQICNKFTLFQRVLNKLKRITDTYI